MGYASTTFGSTNRAKGDYSVAMGIGTISKYGALTIGQYNDTIFNEKQNKLGCNRAGFCSWKWIIS